MKKSGFSRTCRRAAAAGILAVSVCAVGYAAGASLFFSPEFEKNGNTVKVETTSDGYESVNVDVNRRTASGVSHIDSGVQGFITQSGMVVDFEGHAELVNNPAMGYLGSEQSKYVVTDGVGTYHAEGGSKVSKVFKAPLREIRLPLTDEDNPETDGDDTKIILAGGAAGTRRVTGDEKKPPRDSTYDYTVHTILEQGRLSLETISIDVKEHVGEMEHGGMTHVRSALRGTPNDSDGQNIRSAGTLQPGEVQLKKGPGNRYTFEKIEFNEGAKDISFVLTGSQELEQDAYLYSSEIKGGKPSQTMVGIASGKRRVSVSMDIQFVLDIQDELSSSERYWRWEKGFPNPRPNGGMPETGDGSRLMLWTALMLAGCAGLVWRRRKSA